MGKRITQPSGDLSQTPPLDAERAHLPTRAFSLKDHRVNMEAGKLDFPAFFHLLMEHEIHFL